MHAADRSRRPRPAAADEPNQPLDWLALWAHYDDGFVAFLNGAEVARANAPQTLAWNSTAPTDRSRTNVLREERFDLSGFTNLIAPGANVLAIHALNDRADSPDFLLRARMENTQVTLGPTGYMTAPSPGQQNATADLGLVADPVVDQQRGFYSAPMQVPKGARDKSPGQRPGSLDSKYVEP
jgi:hypothetical protein